MGMNLIDYNKAVEALEKERQLLLNREQYGAENVLVQHALNVIAVMPVIRQPEIVRCKDCKWFEMPRFGERGFCKYIDIVRETTFYCADGEVKDDG